MELLSIFILWLRPAFWSRDIIMYLVLSALKYSFLQNNLIEIIQVWEHCTEKSYTEFDRNWARNVENTYVQISIDPNEWSTAFYKPILKYIAWVQDNCMEKLYTEWSKSGKICWKYQQIYIYIHGVNYSSQSPHCNGAEQKPQQLNCTVWTNYIPSLIETGQETYKTPALYPPTSLSTDSYYAKISMTPTVTRENYVETSCAECYWNWVRNVEYMSKYIFINMSEVHHLIKPF
jgi:hypothetical protein